MHLLGLLGNGTVHASTAHLYALLFMCKENNLQNVNLHLITDGRDSPPKAALTYLDDIKQSDQLKIGRIASITEDIMRWIVTGDGSVLKSI